MKILLVHQNYPGQFVRLSPVLLSDSANEIVVLTMNTYSSSHARERVVRYGAKKGTAKDVHPWLVDFETKIIRAEAALEAGIKLRDEGFLPDIILAHPGWGESLFLKKVWPTAKLIIYCEFFYLEQGSDFGFDPEFGQPDPVAGSCQMQLKNLNNLLHFEAADAGIAPTEWQARTFPEPFRSKIRVIHDGIDTNLAKPDDNVWIQIGAHRLTRKDEVITFVNRNLEPYRGYHIFMRALPEIMARRPNAKVVIVGGNQVSYGAPSPDGRSWKDIFLDEVRDKVDTSRLLFVGNIKYQDFIPLLQVSSVHVYLTYPFVLSWSLLEAMSCGCAIVASDTAPVIEVIKDNETGLLVNFFDCEALAKQVVCLLENPEVRSRLGRQAREYVVNHYDVQRICVPQIVNYVYELAGKKPPALEQ